MLSTLPYLGPYPVEGGHAAASRSAARSGRDPWDNGWARKHEGQMPTMTTAHPEASPQTGRLRTSTYQYAPRFLLYLAARWAAVRPDDLVREVGQAMPEEARPGWEALATGPPPPDSPAERRAQWERDAIPTARWIADQGITIGIRTPPQCAGAGQGPRP